MRLKMKLRLVQAKDGKNYLFPFLLITSLFFLWGFAHSILDVLNKHFQDAMEITKTRSALIQAVVYGGYFIMAIPAGRIIRRFGYRTGVITGLLLYGTGSLLFIPGSHLMSFNFFLFSLFVIGCGLTCLETAANPYVTVLGDAAYSERRINLAQSFNGLGWIFGPLVGGFFLFSGEANIAAPYAIIGVIVLIVAYVFSRIRLPEIGLEEEQPAASAVVHQRPLWQIPTFTLGLVSLFLYVAAQTGINSFFINYVTEQVGITAGEASVYLSFGGMGLFMAGRMGGSFVMKYIRPERLLLLCALGAIGAMLAVICCTGRMGLYGFLFCFLCESIMFPTIFALAIKQTGVHTKQASSYLIMSIVGGAVAPLLMGYIADHASMAEGFCVPLVCFAVIAAFAAVYHKLSMER